jgi:hypothetical protein
LSGKEGFGVLPPAELERRDSGVFEELKWLISFTPKVGRSDEVAEVIYVDFQASDAGLLGVRRWRGVCCLTLIGAVVDVGVRRWKQERRTLTSASDQLVVLQRSKGVASDALVVWRLTRDVSVHWRWRQQIAEATKALGSIRR